jgi:DNA-directed RNA polymerase specialized sigma subunit
MTFDEVRAWLNQARGIDREIRHLEEIRAQTFDRLTQTTQSYDKLAVQSSPDPHKLDGIAALDERIIQQINRLSMHKADVLEVISTIEDSRLRAVLIGRYIEGKTFERIAADEFYSWRNVHRLHAKALRLVAEMLKDE